MSTEEPPKRLKVDQAKVEQGLNGLEAPIDLENEEPVADTEEDALLEQELRSAQAELDKVRPSRGAPPDLPYLSPRLGL